MSVSFIESVWSALRAQHARGGPDAPWLVAFSGGTDSLALALLLRRFARAEPAPKITLVHIDHGLHEASRDWAAAAELLSAKVGFPFHAVRVSVSSANGIEAGARTVRYDALGSLLEPGGAVLTAHHQQDQAETVLLRLMRGAGVEGLGAMAAYRRFRDGWLVRPLLDADRRELAEMVRNSGLEPLHDPANDDRRFDRSFLRAEIMPVLRGRWPAMDRTLARSAKRRSSLAGSCSGSSPLLRT
ncbi:MAG: tRNA lysidine(34) synthetase TilS, partial [Pseudomonadota bacterium]